MPVLDRLKKAWNAFVFDKNNEQAIAYTAGASSSHQPSRSRFMYSNERSIVGSIYNTISMDVASIVIRHAHLDEQGRYKEDIPSAMNRCFSLEPNIDQAPSHFLQDIVNTMFDRGVAAIVPVDTSNNPITQGRYDVHTMRVGYVTAWYPKHVRVSVYNEDTGVREEITLPKRLVPIVENPLYAVMNEPNSTLQRLIRKLTLLDVIDEQSRSGKLDIIIQVPYAVKSESSRNRADSRKTDIELQLQDSQYGIAYIDGTEKITQLNRPAENNLLAQVEYLVPMLYGQLGITAEVMNGTADEKTMLNYYGRTVDPIVRAIVQAMRRTFLGDTGIDAGEEILYFRNPFALVPLEKMADIADKFIRNEVLTSNEIRGFLGVAPSTDPGADKLSNPNMPQPEDSIQPQTQDETEA